MNYTGLSGSRYVLDMNYISRGGEGTIYKVAGQPRLDAKIYHSGMRTTLRLNKLKAMMKISVDSTMHAQIAWPLDILFDSQGEFAGFVMRHAVGSKQINELYELSARKKYLWDFFINIAANLSLVVGQIHKAGQVIGDFNPNNILVDPVNGTVTLIDCDSFQITDRTQKTVFPCEVGLPGYLPPELCGPGSRIHYSRQTDHFALAIHIFALLMNGAHPYNCAVTGFRTSSSAATPHTNIARGRCPYFIHADGLTIPMYAPPITILPPGLQTLFHQTFVEGHTRPAARPSAEMWLKELKVLSNSLVRCPTNPAHLFYKHNSFCPWCRTEAQMQGILCQNPVKGCNPVRQTAPQKDLAVLLSILIISALLAAEYAFATMFFGTLPAVLLFTSYLLFLLLPHLPGYCLKAYQYLWGDLSGLAAHLSELLNLHKLISLAFLVMILLAAHTTGGGFPTVIVSLLLFGLPQLLFFQT